MEEENVGWAFRLLIDNDHDKDYDLNLQKEIPLGYIQELLLYEDTSDTQLAYGSGLVME